MIETPGGLLVEPIPRSLGLDERPGLQQLTLIGPDKQSFAFGGDSKIEA